MARTLSNILPLGTTATDFSLHDTVTDKEIILQQEKGKVATVIMFICNHCPFVKHVNSQLVELANDYMELNYVDNPGINFIAISSNDITKYPEDSPQEMKRVAIEKKYPFPYLFDETQEVAKQYQAACTPDFFIYDKDLRLVYHGQLDDSRPGNYIPVTGKDIREVLDCLMQNWPITIEQKSSIGCGIKWKKM